MQSITKNSRACFGYTDGTVNISRRSRQSTAPSQAATVLMIKHTV